MRNPLVGTGLRRYTRKHLVHDRDAARAEVLRLEGVIRTVDARVHELEGEVAQLKADAVDVGVERQLRAAAEEKATDLERRLRAAKARVANENAISLPPPYRDIGPDEAPTHPHGLDVRTLRDALNPTAA